jgi:putative phage-type endonuclease
VTAFDRLPIQIPDNTNEESETRTLWLAERRKGIGSSDCAAACGLSPYKTELQLYMEKTGQIAEADLSDNAKVRMGNRLEQSIADEYEYQTGRKLRKVKTILRSKNHPFMLASLDREVVGEQRIVELKTAGYWSAKQDSDWGPPGTDLVPLIYALQVTHEMIVRGVRVADLAVLVAGQETNIYTLEANEQLMALVIEREREFWRRVVEGDPPAPRTLDDTLLAFPRANEKPVYASAEIAGLVGEMDHLSDQIDALQEQFDARKVEVQTFMGEADTLYLDTDKLATWKNVETTRFDSKRCKNEAPDIYARFAKESSSRRFQIVGGK